MSIASELYTVLHGISGTPAVYDTKLPDNFVLTTSVIVFQDISDVPEDVDIKGTILRRVARWQVSIHCLDIASARTAKAAVIAALHGYRGTSISRADFENCPGEIFDSSTIPFQYFIPIDFLIQF